MNRHIDLRESKRISVEEAQEIPDYPDPDPPINLLFEGRQRRGRPRKGSLSY